MNAHQESSRRKAPRLAVNADVKHILATDVVLPASMVNLSRSGLSIESEGVSTPPTIRFAWLQFALPCGQRVRALGERIYETKHVDQKMTHGYRFKYIAPKERLALNQFMEAKEAVASA